MESWRSRLVGGGICLGAACLALGLAGAAALRAEPVETIGVDAVTRGQRGYGLSVFAGTEPQRFEVEVLGVLRNLGPDSSFIMARLSGQNLEDSGVISGMSGSPVYFDDRLAGAVAFSWSFSQGAIAGITPIADMRKLVELGQSQGPASAAAASMGSAWPTTRLETDHEALLRLASGAVEPEALEAALAGLRGRSSGAAADSTSALQWAAIGFDAAAGSLLERSLGAVDLVGVMNNASAVEAGTVQAEGGEGGATTLPPPDAAVLPPGSPVAALLVDGDLRLAAVGTVTDRIGADLLAMGHAVLGSGPVSLPMAEAEIVTVVSSRQSSFKVSNLGREVGSFTQDRRAGLLGEIGKRAPTLPMTVTIRGELQGGLTERVFHMRLAEVPAITPAMAATSVLGSIETASYRSGPLGLDVTARFQLAGHDDLESRFSFDGPSAGIQAASYLLGLTSYLLQNNLEQAKIEAIDVEIDQSSEPRTVLLLGAHADRSTAAPGDEVIVYLETLPFRGTLERRPHTVRLPEDLPEGKYYLMIGDGASINEARQTVEPRVPRTLEASLDFLSRSLSNRQLAVLGLVAAQGLSVSGRSLPQLPGSVRALWGSAPAGSTSPLRLAVIQEETQPLERPLSGVVRIDLDIEYREETR